ncbi:MAG TPA: hypothetical protein VF699_08310 [Caulobacteraceae bacterium]
MVNYNRMEDVPRAYGPLEPIGPTRLERRREGFAPPPGRRRSYAARNFVMGATAVVLAGGALGFYFRPDLGEEPARGGPVGAPPEPASGEGVEIMVAEGPGPVVAQPAALPPMDPDLGYAEIADAAIGSAVATPAASSPMEVYRSPPPEPAPAAAAPAARERSGPFSAARRTIGRMMPDRASQPKPPPARAAAAPARPMVIARNDAAPTPVVVQPAPRLAPTLARVVERPVVVARADPPRAAPAPEPEPDCARLRGAGARTVCENPQLAALDRRLAAEFERAVAAGHDRARLNLDQDSWLARREAAAPDTRAVAEAYERRIRQLRSMQ